MKYLIIIAALCCFIGIIDLPIGYYTFLRIIVSFMALIIIVNEFRSRRFWFIAFALIFIFFNPFIPIYLYLRPYWVVIDSIVGILLFIYFLRFIPKKKIKQSEIIDIEHLENPRTRDRIIK